LKRRRVFLEEENFDILGMLRDYEISNDKQRSESSHEMEVVAKSEGNTGRNK
jgi:hypothetical protein